MRHEPGFVRCISEKPLTSTRAHTARAGDRYVMTKGRKGDSYIGRHTLMRDPSWSRKLAGRLRKTRKHQERAERAQQRQRGV
jgi:hypothetical protein